MRTLAVDLDDAVLEKAEQKAQLLQTSVSDVVATYLQDWIVEIPERERQQKERMESARQELRARFAKRDWQFSVGTPDSREQRNARR